MSDLALIRPAFFRILPIVTGRGEEQFFPNFMRSLTASGKCCFVKPRWIGQLSPRSDARRLKMVQTGKRLTSRQEQVALLARKFLQESDAHLVILVDDLEDRADEIQSVFETYRQPFDALLTPAGLESHASVHFMATMIEAYYFGDANAINEVLGTSLADCEDDPESIRNPKAKLKQHVKSLDPSRSFDEKADGFQIASKLDLPKVLSNPATCQSLRSLVKWCSRTIGDEDTERFQLTVGNICDVTGTQIPPANR